MGYIYLYYGTGGGKTTNALGLALRTVGHGRSVVIIQFLKWKKDIGEYLIKDKLAPYYEIYQFGRQAWLGEKEKTAAFAGETFHVERFTSRDKELAMEALDFAARVLREKKPHLLVLDEICLAVQWKLLDVKDVLKLLDTIPEETTVVMTGRLAPKELVDRADFVNNVELVKMPNKFKSTEGIQY
ncbi:MAG: cob(I)yrinic acid a,c-diamide adenosyltransferase [Candidatus Bathyarchaeota archaeon]|nr:cob(I)yrinic acid a,c-diamide adenosyltransferase [Candidatus Bathyarchaeota archaeon]